MKTRQGIEKKDDTINLQSLPLQGISSAVINSEDGVKTLANKSELESKELSRLKRELEQKTVELERQNREINSLSDQLSQTKSQLKEQKADELELQLTEAKRQIKEYKKIVNQQNLEIIGYQELNTQKPEAEINEIKQQRASLSDIEKEQKEIREYRAQILLLEETVKSLKSENCSLIKRILDNSLLQELQAEKQKTKELCLQMVEIKSQIEAIQMAQVQYASEIETLTSQKSITEAKLNQMKEQRIQLPTFFEQQRKEFERLTKEFKSSAIKSYADTYFLETMVWNLNDQILQEKEYLENEKDISRGLRLQLREVTEQKLQAESKIHQINKKLYLSTSFGINQEEIRILRKRNTELGKTVDQLIAENFQLAKIINSSVSFQKSEELSRELAEAKIELLQAKQELNRIKGDPSPSHLLPLHLEEKSKSQAEPEAPDTSARGPQVSFSFTPHSSVQSNSLGYPHHISYPPGYISYTTRGYLTYCP